MKYKTRKGIEFFIDSEDLDIVEKYIWRVSNGYIRTKEVYLHRLLLNNPKCVVDHIDGNRLNNCKSNLRVCSQKENSRNSISKGGSSKYKGVSWLKRDKRWYSSIMKDGKTYNLGCYKDEDSAAIAYNVKAKEFFGSFAKLNLIKNG